MFGLDLTGVAPGMTPEQLAGAYIDVSTRLPSYFSTTERERVRRNMIDPSESPELVLELIDRFELRDTYDEIDTSFPRFCDGSGATDPPSG